MEFTKKNRKKVEALLAICKKMQGQYIPAHHGPGSWATTYSTQFIDAACSLYLVLKRSGSHSPLYDLARFFRESGIQSCRGANFSSDRIEYLYNSHLHYRLESLKKTIKPVHQRTNCPYCDKQVVDLVQHISQAHSDSWSNFALKNNVDLKGKTRCRGCGCFLKKMEGHEEKCLKTLAKTS